MLREKLLKECKIYVLRSMNHILDRILLKNTSRSITENFTILEKVIQQNTSKDNECYLYISGELIFKRS